MSYKEKNFNDIASNSILPAGVYNITIKDAKDKTALDGMSEYVSITAVTSEGNHVFANHMTECNSEKAVSILESLEVRDEAAKADMISLVKSLIASDH